MSNEQLVYNAGIDLGMPDVVARLLVAQAKHESADFTSTVFKVNNNAFGYKYVGQSGAWKGSKAPANEGGYYAAYTSVYDSAKEVVRWWQRRIKEGKVSGWDAIAATDSYAAALKVNGYYGDSLSNYTLALGRWLGTVSVGNVALVASPLLLLLLAYLLFKL